MSSLASSVSRRMANLRLVCRFISCCVRVFFFSSRRRHTRCLSDWSSDVCSSDLMAERGITRKATYYYGARGRRDLCFEDELRGLEGSLANFRYVPALSEPAEGDE